MKFQKPQTKHITKARDLSGLLLSESIYPPNLRQPRHTHEFASFSFVLAGSYVENFDRRTQKRLPSTVVFHPPQQSHSVDYEGETVRIFNVGIDFKRLAQIRRHSIILDASSDCRTETINWLGRRMYQEFRRIDAASALSIEGLVLEILAEASRARVEKSEKKSRAWLRQTKEFLHDNFSKSFVLDDVAREIGVHPAHLSRVFRQSYGCTIGEYLRRLRVDFACREILKSDAPLSEIAARAGFADQSHLNKTFKNLYGLTPSEYRKTFRRC
jgi:AraC family transcriptional regulator